MLQRRIRDRLDRLYKVFRMLAACVFVLAGSSYGVIGLHTAFARSEPSVRFSWIKSPQDFTPYSTDEYTINYPTNWQVAEIPIDRMFGGSPIFQSGDRSLLIYGSIDTFPSSEIVSDYVSNLVSYAGYHKLPATSGVTVNGMTWSQGGVIGQNAQTGKLEEQRILVIQNPYVQNHYKHFEVLCRDDASSFNATYQSVFLPMLQSFHFSSRASI